MHRKKFKKNEFPSLLKNVCGHKARIPKILIHFWKAIRQVSISSLNTINDVNITVLGHFLNSTITV